MPISMRCPGCQTRFTFADDLAGKRIKCKSCGDIFRVTDPAPAAADEADDRPARARRRGDADDDRPVSRTRRPVVADEADDDRPARARRRAHDDADNGPRTKKLNPLLIILPLGLVFLVGLAVVVIVLVRSGAKSLGPSAADVVARPSRSCPLEVAEKEAGTLVLPDRGNTFGLLRKRDRFGKTWTFEPYDLAAQKRTGTFDLTNVENPKDFSLSPDGKRLLVTEVRGSGGAGDKWLSLWGMDGKRITDGKWFPYPADTKRPFDAPALYRAEFVANDQVLTLGTNRSFYIYPIPTVEASAGMVPAVEKEGLGTRSRPSGDLAHVCQWEAAWTADHSRMAVWTGDGYAIVNTADGVETNRTTSARQIAQDEWGRTAGDPARVKGGPVAFSPDGTLLAAVLQADFGSKRALVLWDAREPKLHKVVPLAENQWNDAASICWWGNRFVVSHTPRTEFGTTKVDGLMIDVQTGQPRRQLMGPRYNKFGFTRDGKVWYMAGDERTEAATLHVVDGLDPELLTGPDDYEQFEELGREFFLRRLWLEPAGVLRQPTREDPPLRSRLIRRP